MKFITNVHGSEASAKPLVVGKTTVYVHTNIHTKTVTDEMGEHIVWVYDEAQYTKNEWINELTKQNETIKADNEELAITMADFLAEYYLSQLGVDDFEMEGGEEE